MMQPAHQRLRDDSKTGRQVMTVCLLASRLALRIRDARSQARMGDSPTGVGVSIPVAWVVSVEETKRMKPTDKAILGMVSESPGRNASEPIGGLEKK